MSVRVNKLFTWLVIAIAIFELPLLFVAVAYLRVNSTIWVVAIVLGGLAFMACLVAWAQAQSRAPAEAETPPSPLSDASSRH